MRALQITQTITNRENQSVQIYFNEIAQEELIPAQEEAILARKIRDGDQAALEKLVKSNLRFVVSVAKKYQYQGLALIDLINEGNLGLIKAARRFDEARGFKFISFAVWWIRQSIMLAISENARMIRLPMNKIGEITRINKAITLIEQETLREPTNEQIAEHLDITVEKVNDALYCAPWASSLDAPVCDGDNYSLLDRVPSQTEAADHGLIAESVKLEIDQLLMVLSARERKIIKLAYGITGGVEMSHMAISMEIGLCPESIRQIHNKAIQKLRDSAIAPGNESSITFKQQTH